MSIEIIPETNGIYIKFLCEVEIETISNLIKQVIQNESFKEINYFIADYTQITKTNIEDFRFLELAQQSRILSNWNLRLVGALVVKSEHQHLAEEWLRIINNLELRYNTKVFNNISEARTWINSQI